MRQYARHEEIATLVAENNDNARSAVKKMHHFLRGRNLYDLNTNYLFQIGKKYLPLTKIIDSVHFAAKDEAILLQLADACAFTYRLYLEKKENAADLFSALTCNKPEMLEPYKSLNGGLAGYNLFYF